MTNKSHLSATRKTNTNIEVVKHKTNLHSQTLGIKIFYVKNR